MRLGTTLLRRFIEHRRGVAAVEFAIASLAIFAFIMVLLNLGLLGLEVSLQARATQATARAATVAVSKYYTVNGSYDCAVSTTTSYSSISTMFDSFSNPALPTSGTFGGSNPLITATWYNTPSSATSPALPTGIALMLTSQYTWRPIGFAKLGNGITLKISTVAMVMSSSGTSATVSSDCGSSS